MTNSTIHEGQTDYSPRWHLFTNRHPTTHGEPWGAIEATRHPAGGAGDYPDGMTITWRGEQGRSNAQLIIKSVYEHPSLSARVKELERINGELLTALRKYGDHEWHCFTRGVEYEKTHCGCFDTPVDAPECDCGIRETVAQHSNGGAA